MPRFADVICSQILTRRRFDLVCLVEGAQVIRVARELYGQLLSRDSRDISDNLPFALVVTIVPSLPCHFALATSKPDVG